MTKVYEKIMLRCFDLARLGQGKVSPNPMVGAVLVYNGHIIGEGYHKKYGEAHAEVNAVNSVKNEDRHLISQSCLYVSLEPCSIYGRTPPCTNLVIKHKIPKVVISCLDATPSVNGKGVQLLKEAGVEVITGVLEEKGLAISKIRQHFVQHNRPYVSLKFAQTQNHKFGKYKESFWITNAYSKRLTHKWRNEIDAILIGTNTALIDNPQLNNRLYFGASPLRVVLDKSLKIPTTHQLYNGKYPTLIVTNQLPLRISDKVEYLTIDFDDNLLPTLLAALQSQKISHLMVEGGATLINDFIKQDLWNEALVFTGNKILKEGMDAPVISSALFAQYKIGNDVLSIYRN